MRIARRIRITQERINRYGRANGDSERLHYDGEYARQHGFRGPIAHGTLLAATVFDLALQKFGAGFLRRGSVSLMWKSAVCAGDTQLATIEEDGRIQVIIETVPGQPISMRGQCSVEGSEMNIERDAQLYFDDFEIGQIYPGQARKLGEEEFALFARVTGDSHPIHYDAEYAKNSRFGERVAHGLLLTSITALGAIPLSAQLEESMVAFVEQDARFEKPVLIGDTVRTEFRVEELRPTRSGLQGFVRFAIAMANGHGEQVLSAHHTYLLKTRQA